MDNCIFCKIAQKQIPSKVIFEDDKTLAFLDINPASKGHILLIPKEHKSSFLDLEEDLINHISSISHRLSGAIIANLKAAGVTTLIQEGQEAGQKAPHFLLHLIPRYENDNLSFKLPTNIIEENTMKTIREAILESLR